MLEPHRKDTTKWISPFAKSPEGIAIGSTPIESRGLDGFLHVGEGPCESTRLLPHLQRIACFCASGSPRLGTAQTRIGRLADHNGFTHPDIAVGFAELAGKERDHLVAAVMAPYPDDAQVSFS